MYLPVPWIKIIRLVILKLVKTDFFVGFIIISYLNIFHVYD